MEETAAHSVEETPPEESSRRYRRLPTGAHGLDREEVRRDQRERLQSALIELIAQRGYQAVRIVDLTQLAHVSRPTFYELYADKEELFLGTYNEIAERTARVVLDAYRKRAASAQRLRAGMRAFTELAAAEPDAISLLLLGAFGAGPEILKRRKASIAALEQGIESSREYGSLQLPPGLIVRIILGGVREVAAARLSRRRPGELPALADELAAWATCYPERLPPGIEELPPPPSPPPKGRAALAADGRARRAHSRLPSGRHDLPRELVQRSQRERIVNATAQIVAAKGLAGLTIPEITARANVSNETFYEMYSSKLAAFLATQKIGMQKALQKGVEAWEARMPDWPRAIADGARAVVGYVVSEPAHAHLSIIDAFGASPETIATRDQILSAFATYFDPGYELPGREERPVPAIAAEAVVGAGWQLLHRYIEEERIAELPEAEPQLIFMLLTPFLGPKRAAEVALEPPQVSRPAAQPAGRESA